MGSTEPGVVLEQFILRARAGESPEVTSHRGLPVGAALREYAGVESIGYLTVPRPNGTSAYVAGEALEEPSPKFEGGLAALFAYNEGSTRFMRPPIAGDPNDVNAEDNIATVAGEALVVGIHDGNILGVSATASSTTPGAGTPVQLEAEAGGAKAGETLAYHWSFGDGTGAEGPSASHAFTAAGTYRVTLTVTGSAESGGEAQPLKIVVGNPPTGTEAGAQPAKAEPKHKAHGGSGEPKRGATLGTPDEADPGSERVHSEVGGPVVGPLHSRTAGRFVQGSHDRPVEPLRGLRSGVTHGERHRRMRTEEEGSEASRTEERGEAGASGRTVIGQLVADYVGAAGGAEASGGSADAGSGSVAAAPQGDPASVPVMALIAAALLLGGVVFERRRQLGGRRR